MAKRQEVMGKAETEKHWKAMLESRQILRAYCRKAKIRRSDFILGMIRHFPHEWEDNQHLVGPIGIGTCGFCTREFYQNVGKQSYCDELCATNARLTRDPHANNPRLRATMRRKQEEAELASKGEENPAG